MTGPPPVPPPVPSAAHQVRAVLEASIPAFDPTGSADEWTARAAEVRSHAVPALFGKGLVVDDSTPPAVEWGATYDADTYRLHLLRYEAVAGYWVPALLYVPADCSTPLPAVLNADGHLDAGNAAESKQIRSVNLARRGVVVLSFEFVGMGELSGDCDLDPALGASLHFNLSTHELVGIGAPALMYAVMRRGLDVLAAHPAVDPTRVVMTGLSGGGWQTIVLAANDPRIAGAVPVAGYTSIAARVGCDEDVGDLEQVPADMALTADYQLLTAMLAPRPALVIHNEFDDCCFASARAKPIVYDAVLPVYEAFGRADALTFHSSQFPGDHNYGPDNRRQLYGFMRRYFGVEGADDDCHEPSDIRTEQELRVGLPLGQQSVRGLARERARALRPARLQHRGDPDGARRRLRDVLRVPELSVDEIDEIDEPRFGDADERVVASLRIGPWTLPATWTGSAEDASVELVVDDRALAGSTGKARSALDGSSPARCVVDTLGTGSLRVSASQAALLSTAGHRLLGVIVGQLLAIRDVFAGRTVDLVVGGNVPGVAALFAAALRPSSFRSVNVESLQLASLEDLIERGVRYAEAAALFCPDLLTVIDLDEAIALLGATVWNPRDRGGTSSPR